jgi:GNAT superfamily N-acetyltransferase
MRIRRAVPADAAEVWAVRTRAIRHGCASHYPPEELAAWTARATPATCADAIATRQVVVAEREDGRVAGYAQLDPEEGTIEAVYVDPDCARTGVGRALVDALEALARTLGLPGLVVEASLNSVPFYGAIGYGHECWAQHSLGGGHRIACAVMSKRLGEAARTPAT